MSIINCINPFNHAGCRHAGWREHPASGVGHEVVAAARTAANWASNDLGLDLISIRFFAPGPIFSWDVNDRTADKPLVVLNAGTFDPQMMGKAVDPNITPLPTVWIRAGLSPISTAVIVLHEARHIWQITRPSTTPPSAAEEEQDAYDYGWRAVLRLGFEQDDGDQLGLRDSRAHFHRLGLGQIQVSKMRRACKEHPEIQSPAPVSPEQPGGRVERPCPWCAEPILSQAKVCKHCGREVAPT